MNYMWRVRSTGRPKAHGKLIDSFGVAWYEEEKEAHDGLLELAGRDRVGKGDFVKIAVAEYVKRHRPGNPTLPLDTWTKGQGLSIAAREKLGRQSAKPLPLPLGVVELTCQICGGKGCEECGGRGKVFHYGKRSPQPKWREIHHGNEAAP